MDAMQDKIAQPVPPATDEEPYIDPVIEAYKKDIDQTMLDESLKLTPQQRVERFMDHMRAMEEFRRAGERMRREQRA